MIWCDVEVSLGQVVEITENSKVNPNTLKILWQDYRISIFLIDYKFGPVLKKVVEIETI